MPIGAKDSLSGAIDTAATAKGEAQPSQPSSAAGAEVPVTVHASRYSAASKNAGKLPPVHEETSTVVIFPQGAVVRLSATVTPGELVVLTNKGTGEDVICRVTNVKTQPGIQNYVHLEFTQRALDFWQEGSAVRQAESEGKPRVATPPLPPKATVSRERTVQSSSREPNLPGKTQPPIEIKSAPAAPKITSLADGPAGNSDDIPKASTAKPRISEISPPATVPHKSAAVPPVRTPRLQPFEASIPAKSTSSKVVLFAIAAVVLLTICGIAATVLLRQDHGEISALKLPNSRSAESGQTLPALADTASPTTKSSPGPVAFEPAATVTSKNSPAATPAPQPAALRVDAERPKPAEPAKPAEVSGPEVKPQLVTRPILNVGKIAAPRMKTAAQVAAPEPPPVLPADSDSSTSVVGESLSNSAARVNPITTPALAAPAPVRGGQLQQPKLLSSTAPVYPALARSQRVQGDVTIDALIDATGKVSNMKILTGNALLENAATEALRHWKYQPALLNGEAIPVHINVTITFHLN